MSVEFRDAGAGDHKDVADRRAAHEMLLLYFLGSGTEQLSLY